LKGRESKEGNELGFVLYWQMWENGELESERIEKELNSSEEVIRRVKFLQKGKQANQTLYYFVVKGDLILDELDTFNLQK